MSLSVLDPVWIRSLLAGAGAGLLSAPHCAAMCGPLATSACLRAPGGGAPLRYQLGRMASYVFGGMLAGQLGTVLHEKLLRSLPFWLFPAGAALGMLLFAARILSRSRGVQQPQLVQVRKRPKLTVLLYRLVPRDPLTFGLVSALLPCGALAVGWTIAALSGTAPTGALAMLGFSITSGSGVFASSWLLRRAASVQHAWLTRALAGCMIAAALVVMLRPILTHADPQGAASAHPSCHGADANLGMRLAKQFALHEPKR